jgi:hypothetical protein
MGVREALLQKILGLTEKEAIQGGESALARGMAEKAAIQASEAEAAAVSKDLLKDKLLQENYEQFSRPSRMSAVDEINAANSGFSNKPRLTGPAGNPLGDIPNFEMVGAPRTEIPKGGQNFQLKGDAYSGNVPAVPPQAGPHNFNVGTKDLPAIIEPGVGGLPAELPHPIRDVSPAPMSRWDKVMAAAKANELPITLGLTSAGVAGAGLMTGKTADKGGGGGLHSPYTGGLTDLPGFPPKQEFGPQDLLVDKNPEEPKEEPKVEETEEDPMGSNEGYEPTGGKIEEKDEPSKVQTLADTLEANPDEETFADVQKRQALATLANQLGSAGDIIGGAIARTGPNEAAQKMFGNNIKLAENMTSGFKDRKAMEEHDANSAVSKNYREFLKRYGVNAPENVTAAQIKAVLLPAAEKESLQKERLDAQKDMKEIQLEGIRATRQQTKVAKDLARQDKLDKDNINRIDRANKLITAEVASSRSAFGRAGNTYQSAEKLEALVHDIDPNDLDTRQITEIARNLDAMLTMGQPTISGMKKLLPHTATGDVAKIKEYISNIPKGAQQGDFVRRMMETVKREKELADKQMRRSQGKLLSSFVDLKDHPNMKSVLRANGIPEDVFDAPVELSTAEKKQTLEFAKVHNMTYDQAEQLILTRKKQKMQMMGQ